MIWIRLEEWCSFTKYFELRLWCFLFAAPLAAPNQPGWCVEALNLRLACTLALQGRWHCCLALFGICCSTFVAISRGSTLRCPFVPEGSPVSLAVYKANKGLVRQGRTNQFWIICMHVIRIQYILQYICIIIYIYIYILCCIKHSKCIYIYNIPTFSSSYLQRTKCACYI